MPDSKQHMTCIVELRAGSEELALRRFHTPEEACTWLLSTAAKLRGAVDGELMDKIADKFAVELYATVTEDEHTGRVPVFSGKLRSAEDGLRDAVKAFETKGLADFHQVAVKAGHERRGRKLIKHVVISVLGAFGIAGGYYAIKMLPPIFDSDVQGLRLLTAPHAKFAGQWRPAGAENCEVSRIDFQRAKFEMLAAGRLRSYAATFESPNDWTLRVEYTDGNVRIAQTYRLTEELGAVQLVAVTANDPEVQAAARKLVGTRFVRCG
ncbi:MAG: hypothetical protein GC202_04120 [Alphaproteobacteria bacterium]|nr:hypothetical protein [Alphaproteobacteria bacterium]